MNVLLKVFQKKTINDDYTTNEYEWNDEYESESSH